MRRRLSFSLLGGLIAVGTVASIGVTPGCNGSSDPNGRSGPVTAATPWSLLFYAMGRNESGNAADDARKQINTANVSANVNYEAAFSPINLSSPPFQSTRRFLVNKGVETVLTDKGQAPMVSGSEFADYVSVGGRTGASQRYCLVVHGHHGGPVRSFGADTAGVTTFDLAALDTALTNGRAGAAISKIDVIVLDVPHSATIEAMSVLAKHASFMVAHTGAAPSTGFDYAGLISTFGTNANIDARALATAIANGLTAKVNGSASKQSFESCAVALDLSKMGTVQLALNNLGGALSADLAAAGSGTTAAIAAIGSARTTCVEMDAVLNTQLVDAGDFAARIASGGFAALSTTTTSAANSLVSALQGATATAAVASANGLYQTGQHIGVYFPPHAGRLSSSFASSCAELIAKCPKWAQFLTDFHTSVSARNAPVVAINTAPANITAGQTFTVTATVTPANEIRQVSLYLTIPSGANNAALLRIPLGTPFSSGAIAFTGTANTVGLVLSGNSSIVTILSPLSNAPAKRLLSFDADVNYSIGGVPTTIAGVVKLGVASVQTANALVPLAWTPGPGSNATIARNDRLTSSGVSYQVFPRVVILSTSSGPLTVTAFQSSQGVTVVGGIENVIIDNNGGLAGTPTSATLWIVAEGLNGKLGFSNANVTIQ